MPQTVLTHTFPFSFNIIFKVTLAQSVPIGFMYTCGLIFFTQDSFHWGKLPPIESFDLVIEFHHFFIEIWCFLA